MQNQPDECECSICLANLDQPMVLQNCLHSFCKDCIGQWLDIKNNCPLCLDLIGTVPHNKLNKKNQQFDNGVLQFQSQVSMIRDNLKHIQKRIINKRAQSKNLKNHFPASSLMYVEDQLLLVHNYNDILTESVFINDRQNVSFYLQLITQVLMDMQDVLNGGPVGKMQQEQYYEDHEDYYSSQQQQFYQQQKFKNKALKKDKPRQKKSQMADKKVES